jgi:hypothetical protein
MRLLDKQPLTEITGAEGDAYVFFCPACENMHFFAVNASKGPSWAFNGNPASPTFSPSLKITGTIPLTESEYKTVMSGQLVAPKPMCCHLNITDGKIQYHGDCTHSFRNQTIEMGDVDA